MILGSEEENDVVTLDESSITSLLAGAGVTITRTSGSSSPAPRSSNPILVKTATTARAGMLSSSKTTTPSGRKARLAPNGQGVAPLSQKPQPAQVFSEAHCNLVQELVFSIRSWRPRRRRRQRLIFLLRQTHLVHA